MSSVRKGETDFLVREDAKDKFVATPVNVGKEARAKAVGKGATEDEAIADSQRQMDEMDKAAKAAEEAQKAATGTPAFNPNPEAAPSPKQQQEDKAKKK